jgi:hypothetical protein
MMAYPMGLPEYDLVRINLEGQDDINEFIPVETATLWMAGKEFFRDQLVRDRVGKNEKTKVICKLSKAGSGPPAREPAISEGTVMRGKECGSCVSLLPAARV